MFAELQGKQEYTSQGLPRYQVAISYLEIYNENVFDLLSFGTLIDASSSEAKQNHRFRNNIIQSSNSKISLNLIVGRDGYMYAQNARQILVTTTDEALAVFHAGARHKTMRSNNINSESSRSHSIFLATIYERKDTQDDLFASPDAHQEALTTVEKVVFPDSTIEEGLSVSNIVNTRDGSVQYGYSTVSRITVVDLAGAERQKRTALNQDLNNARTNQFLEATSINKSLTWLQQCFNELRSTSAKGARALKSWSETFSWRTSKLTYLLKDALAGACVGSTAFFVCAGPAAEDYDETIRSVSFAASILGTRMYREQPAPTKGVGQYDANGRLRRKDGRKANERDSTISGMSSALESTQDPEASSTWGRMKGGSYRTGQPGAQASRSRRERRDASSRSASLSSRMSEASSIPGAETIWMRSLPNSQQETVRAFLQMFSHSSSVPLELYETLFHETEKQLQKHNVPGVDFHVRRVSRALRMLCNRVGTASSSLQAEITSDATVKTNISVNQLTAMDISSTSDAESICANDEEDPVASESEMQRLQSENETLQTALQVAQDQVQKQELFVQSLKHERDKMKEEIVRMERENLILAEEVEGATETVNSIEQTVREQMLEAAMEQVAQAEERAKKKLDKTKQLWEDKMYKVILWLESAPMDKTSRRTSSLDLLPADVREVVTRAFQTTRGKTWKVQTNDREEKTYATLSESSAPIKMTRREKEGQRVKDRRKTAESSSRHVSEAGNDSTERTAPTRISKRRRTTLLRSRFQYLSRTRVRAGHGSADASWKESTDNSHAIEEPIIECSCRSDDENDACAVCYEEEAEDLDGEAKGEVANEDVFDESDVEDAPNDDDAMDDDDESSDDAYEALQSRIAEQEVKLLLSSRELSEKTAQVTKLTTIIKEQEEKISRLERLLECAEETATKAVKQAEDASRAASEAFSSTIEVRSLTQKLDAEANEARTKLVEVTKQRDEFLDQAQLLQQVQTQYHEALAELESTKSKLALEETKLQGKDAEINALHSRVTELFERGDSFAKALTSAQVKLQQSEDEMQQLKEQLEQQVETVKSLEASLHSKEEDTVKVMEAHEAEKKRLRSELYLAQSIQSTRSHSTVYSTRNGRDSPIRNSSNPTDDTVAGVAALLSKVEELERELEFERQEHNTTAMALEQLQQETLLQQEAIQNLQSKLEIVQEWGVKSSARIQELEAELQVYETQAHDNAVPVFSDSVFLHGDVGNVEECVPESLLEATPENFGEFTTPLQCNNEACGNAPNSDMYLETITSYADEYDVPDDYALDNGPSETAIFVPEAKFETDGVGHVDSDDMSYTAEEIVEFTDFEQQLDAGLCTDQRIHLDGETCAAEEEKGSNIPLHNTSSVEPITKQEPKQQNQAIHTHVGVIRGVSQAVDTDSFVLDADLTILDSPVSIHEASRSREEPFAPSDAQPWSVLEDMYREDDGEGDGSAVSVDNAESDPINEHIAQESEQYTVAKETQVALEMENSDDFKTPRTSRSTSVASDSCEQTKQRRTRQSNTHSKVNSYDDEDGTVSSSSTQPLRRSKRLRSLQRAKDSTNKSGPNSTSSSTRKSVSRAASPYLPHEIDSPAALPSARSQFRKLSGFKQVLESPPTKRTRISISSAGFDSDTSGIAFAQPTPRLGGISMGNIDGAAMNGLNSSQQALRSASVMHRSAMPSISKAVKSHVSQLTPVLSAVISTSSSNLESSCDHMSAFALEEDSATISEKRSNSEELALPWLTEAVSKNSLLSPPSQSVKKVYGKSSRGKSMKVMDGEFYPSFLARKYSAGDMEGEDEGF